MKIVEFVKKYPLYIFGGVIVFILTVSLTYIFFAINRVAVNPPNVSQIAQAEGERNLPEGSLNFILLGHGGAGHQGGDLMDSIILVSADSSSKKVLIVSIPRDLWIEGRKVNEGFVAGGTDLIKHQVYTITGIKPESFVSVDFDGFKNIIDILGGVDAQVTKTYEDKYYPIKGKELDTCGKTPEEFAQLHQEYSGYQLEIQFECRYEHIKFDPPAGGGTISMNGDTALKYVRSRHGDGDFGRSARQFVVLSAIKDKVLSLGVVTKYGQIFNELVNSVRTNLSVGQIKELVNLIGNPDQYKFTTLHLTTDNVLKEGKSSSGAFILLPRDGQDRWGAVRTFISSNF